MPEASWIVGLLEFLGVFGFYSARHVLDCWIVGMSLRLSHYLVRASWELWIAAFTGCVRGWESPRLSVDLNGWVQITWGSVGDFA